MSYVLSALESIHAALGVMAHNNMPKQLYKEEVIRLLFLFLLTVFLKCSLSDFVCPYILLLRFSCDHISSRMILAFAYQIIERILEFSKHQIVDVMSAYDPSYRALHKPSEHGAPEGSCLTFI